MMSQPATAVVEVALRNCFCATELESVERVLAALTGVVAAHVDRTRSVAHLQYAKRRTTAETLRTQVAALRYRCECVDRPDSCCQPGHPCVGMRDARTNQDRPAEHPSGPSTGHEALQAPSSHDAHAGHGADMVTDMLRRFVASAVLTVPIAALGAKLNTWTYRWMAAWSKWD